MIKRILVTCVFLLLLTGCSDKSDINDDVTKVENKTSGQTEQLYTETTEYDTTGDTTITEIEVKETRITKQPQNVKVDSGETASLSVTAEGANLKYQWFVSVDGTTWTKCDEKGNDTDTIVMSADENMNGYKYQCQIEGDNGSAISKAVTLTVQIPIPVYSVGDVVTFGKYEQDGNLNNGFEQLEWYVVAKEGNKYLLLSKKVLFEKNYNDNYEYGSEEKFNYWDNSTIRTYLNENFYDEAFSEEERNIIKSYSHDGVSDKVFLLDYYTCTKLPNSIAKAYYTEYALTTMAFPPSDTSKDTYFATRTPYDKYGSNESIVYCEAGRDSDEPNFAVGIMDRVNIKPALYVDERFGVLLNDIHIDDSSDSNTDVGTSDTDTSTEDISIDDNIDLSQYNKFGMTFKQAVDETGFFIETGDKYYPLSVGNVDFIEANGNHISFVPTDSFLQRLHSGDRIVMLKFTFLLFEMWKMDTDYSYSNPDSFAVSSDKGVRYNGRWMDKVNGVDSKEFNDYVSFSKVYDYNYFSFNEPTDVEMTYYNSDYEETSITVKCTYKLYCTELDDFLEYHEANEGYYYFDTTGLEPGIYVVTNGFSSNSACMFEIVE